MSRRSKTTTDMQNLPQIIIGCFLQDNSCVDKAIEAGLRPESFGRFSDLFERCVKYRTDGKAFDEFSLLVDKANKEEVLECTSAAPTTLGFASAVQQLIWQDKRGKLTAQAKDLIAELKVSESDDADGISRRLADMQQIAQTTEEKDDKLADVVDEILADLDADLSGTQRSTIELSWGLPDADRFMTPIRQHELVVCAARPSCGKSSLAIHLGRTWLKTKHDVAIFSLETSKKAVLMQIAGQEAGVNIQQITTEPKDRIEYYKKCLKVLAGSPHLQVFDRVMTLDGIEAKCRLLASSFKPHAIIIDYLNIIHHYPQGKGGLYEKTTEISQRMIGLRKHMNCPIILLAQLNRANVNDNNRAPEPHDLRDSGSIEQDAHRLVFIHRPTELFDTDTPQIKKDGMEPPQWHSLLMQKKLRDGPRASVRTVFNAPTTQFLSYGNPNKF